MTPAIQSGADELSASARNYMANEGRRAVDAGFNVLPIKPGDKFPATRNSGGWTPMSEWQRYADRPPTELELDTWAGWPDCGVGIACGEAVAIDVDVEDDAKAAEIKALAISIFGHTPLIRIGRAPRFALIYRSADTMMSGWSRKPFDILGHGRQLVAWGIHPSGCEYHWPDESPAEVYIGELPQIDRATIERFLIEAEKIVPMAERPASKPERASFQSSATDTGLATHEAVASALAALDPGQLDYDGWLRVGMAVHSATHGQGLDLWDQWSARDAARYDSDALAMKWASFSAVGGVGAGTLFAEARASGWICPPGIFMHQEDADRAAQPHPAQEMLDRAMRGDFDRPKPANDDGQRTAATSHPPVLAKPYEWRDPASIPVRQWLYGHMLLRGHLALLVAPGATGKTALLIGHALAMATGRNLLGPNVWGGPKRVWIWNLEDSGEEIARLIQAAAKHWDIEPGELDGQLFVNSALDGSTLTMAMVEGRGGVVILRPVVDALADELTRQKIDVLIVDPFVSSHAVPENDNGAIDAVAKEWSRLSARTDCAILLAHHTKKLAGHEATAEASRGAIALVNAARSVTALNRMSEDEADRCGIRGEERRRYFRAYDDKNNRSPAAGRSDWFHLESVSLGNGGMEGGDSIQVVVPWRAPDAFDGISVDDLYRIQLAIQGGEWRESSQARDGSWAGVAVATTLGLDHIEDKSRILKLLKQWITSGVLKVENRPDKKANPRPHIVVGRMVNPTGFPTSPLASGEGSGGSGL